MSNTKNARALSEVQQRELTAKLRASEATMAAAQRIAHFGSWELQLTNPADVDSNPLHWSDEMYRIAGYEPGAVEVSNDFFFSLVPVEEHEAVRQAVATAIKVRAPYCFVHRFIRPGGEERIVKEMGVIYVDEATGQPSKIVGTAHDITEQCRVERELTEANRALKEEIEERERTKTALLESKRFLESTLNALASHIAILDEQGVIVKVNRAWERFARENHFVEAHCGVGDNYLLVCDSASGRFAEEASVAASGIRAVMAGRSEEFMLEYPCDSAQEQRWFILRATRFGGDGPVRVVVAHENITARKRSEEELHSKTALFEAQVNSTIDGILVVDDHGKKMLQNQRMTDILKIPRHIAEDPDDAEQLRWVTGITKDPGQFLQKVVYLTSHPNEISRDELELKDGTVLDRYSAPVLGKDAKYYGRIWTFRDITGRKRSEAALLESQLRYRSLFENMLEGYAYCRLLNEPNRPCDFIYLEVNAAFETHTGLKNVIGKKVSEVIPGIQENNPELLEIYKRVAATGKPELYESHLESLGIWLSVAIYSHEKEHFVAVFENITERKLAENVLRESDEKFHQLADHITDAFWIRSADMSKVHYLSPAFERIWGRSAESLYASPQEWDGFVFEADRERVLGAFAGLTGDTRSLDLEYRIRRPDGEIRWVHVRGFQVRNSADQLIRHIGIVTDITERKRVESQMVQSQKMETVGKLAGGSPMSSTAS